MLIIGFQGDVRLSSTHLVQVRGMVGDELTGVAGASGLVGVHCEGF